MAGKAGKKKLAAAVALGVAIGTAGTATVQSALAETFRYVPAESPPFTPSPKFDQCVLEEVQRVIPTAKGWMYLECGTRQDTGARVCRPAPIEEGDRVPEGATPLPDKAK